MADPGTPGTDATQTPRSDDLLKARLRRLRKRLEERGLIKSDPPPLKEDEGSTDVKE